MANMWRMLPSSTAPGKYSGEMIPCFFRGESKSLGSGARRLLARKHLMPPFLIGGTIIVYGICIPYVHTPYVIEFLDRSEACPFRFGAHPSLTE